jgi:hypothetical protein
MSRRYIPLAIAAPLVLAAASLVAGAQPAAAAAGVYYVDSVNGGDSRSGASPDQAWQTLDRANRAALAPGDQLLLARGSRFSDRLVVAESGTPGAPILISAYGAIGNTPSSSRRPPTAPA